MMSELYYSTGRGWGMIPDFDNDGRVEQWEGAAADAWQKHAQGRLRGDRSSVPTASATSNGDGFSSRRGAVRSSGASGCGCGNVVLGCGLIVGVLLALAIVIVVFVNAFI